MRLHSHTGRRTRIVVAIATAIGVLAIAGSAAALGALLPGGQVNDELAAGINKAISVNGDESSNANVVGGALTAGKPAVPWAIFQQETNGSPPPNDQAFVRPGSLGSVPGARTRA